MIFNVPRNNGRYAIINGRKVWINSEAERRASMGNRIMVAFGNADYQTRNGMNSLANTIARPFGRKKRR